MPNPPTTPPPTLSGTFTSNQPSHPESPRERSNSFISNQPSLNTTISQPPRSGASTSHRKSWSWWRRILRQISPRARAEQRMERQQIAQRILEATQLILAMPPMERQQILSMIPMTPKTRNWLQKMQQKMRKKVQKKLHELRTFLKNSDVAKKGIIAKEDIDWIVKNVENKFNSLLHDNPLEDDPIEYDIALETLKKRYADIKNGLLALKQLESREPWTARENSENPTPVWNTQSEFKKDYEALRLGKFDYTDFIELCENMCRVTDKNNHRILLEDDYLCISNMLMLMH
jgi:hypothetical protein